MGNSAISSLTTFVRASGGKSQSEILKLFLSALIKNNTVAESGSILVYDSERQKLLLFNDDDFLFKQGFLPRSKNWKSTFEPLEGMAGRAFSYGEIVYDRDATSNRHYIKGRGPIPVKPMVCVPVKLSQLPQPFGVVSFHNDSHDEQFDDEQIELIEVYVGALGRALELSPQRIADANNRRVFIVHGHDTTALDELKKLLTRHKLEPVVLQDKPKVGPEILQKLEKEIGRCMAGFVLLTPDDEGRLKGGQDLQARARQNVIFEAGFLAAKFRNAERVCFLVKKPVEFPSDLKGLLYESFESIKSSRDCIARVLREWSLIPA
jgi:predicted nucleotide-binding protein